MIFEIVVCAFIGIVAVLAILTLWRKHYSRFVPDNKHSVFHVFIDAMDSILFVTSGKKNALHLFVVCALIGIIVVLAILTLLTKKYSRFVPDNKHSFFQVLLDAIDSISFITSGKKNALYLCK
ncbi:hypothetical protein CDAR_593411 [Caerostris darwini]|uniref:Uncharacterized protein n=1 Tax=Caerostris darwini TaxID=1538125 RepID=A0AAV4R9H6_9ARAC|nr:hypothetical protein CDAR_593411 [Caerostris darwini]